MRQIICGLLALGFVAALTTEANAVACGAGPYRAGCVGSHGAVVTRRPYARPVVVAPRCVWRAGVRVCR